MTTNKNILAVDGGSDLTDRMNQRRNSPIPSIERLANNDDAFEAAVLVQADVETGLGNVFTAPDDDDSTGFQLLGDLGAIAQATDDGRKRFSVSWLYACRQTGPLGSVLNDETFVAIHPQADDSRPVLIEGVTVGIEVEPNSRRYEIRRYIDWNLVFAQLGVTTSLRGGDPSVSLVRTVQQAGAPSLEAEA